MPTPGLTSPASSPEIPQQYLLGQFIPLHYHCQMLRDQDRVEAFREAIGHVVKPGMKVLELGGGTGILSFFAAQSAAKVWCVEQNPQLVAASRRFLAANHGGHRVEVVEADAHHYLPPEPVDVVICEMLHVAMLREKQIPVLASFQDRYRRAFGTPLPRFLPEASILAVQPVQQSFTFAGYHAPVPIFQAPGARDDTCRPLGTPVVQTILDYQQPLPSSLRWDGSLPIEQLGRLNALRFVTRNILTVLLDQQRTIDWSNQYLVLPLPSPLVVQPGQQVRVRFTYEAGAPLEALSESLQVQACQAQLPVATRRAA